MITLKKTDDLCDLEITFKAPDATWGEVTEQFIGFLQACGYIVTGEDLAKYLSDQYLFEIPSTKKGKKK